MVASHIEGVNHSNLPNLCLITDYHPSVTPGKSLSPQPTSSVCNQRLSPICGRGVPHRVIKRAVTPTTSHQEASYDQRYPCTVLYSCRVVVGL